MTDLRLSREIDRWRKCDPEIMAKQSEAALCFAFSDMKHDILALYKEVAELRKERDHLQKQVDDFNAVRALDKRIDKALGYGDKND